MVAPASETPAAEAGPDKPPLRKVYLALPTYADTMRRDFVLSLLQALWLDPIPNVLWTLGTVGGDGVARARNNLAQNFLLDSDSDTFCTIDVDIVFSKIQLERLILGCTEARPIVGGHYAAKTLDHRWIKTELEGELPDGDGYQKVYEIGTGFKGARRTPFELMRDSFPEIQYFCDGAGARPVKWDFFSMGVVNGRYLSEDYYFDYRARTIGIPIYADHNCMVQHQGKMNYPFHSNMNISDRVPVGQLFALAEALGDTGTKVIDDVVTIGARMLNPDREWVVREAQKRLAS